MLCKDIKAKFPDKTIWLYTGYKWEDLIVNKFIAATLKYVDVLVDDRYMEDKRSTDAPWVGSSNQRVIDVQKSLEKGSVVLHECH